MPALILSARDWLSFILKASENSQRKIAGQKIPDWEILGAENEMVYFHYQKMSCLNESKSLEEKISVILFMYYWASKNL